MNCPICGKQRMYNNGTCYTVSTTTSSGTAYLSSDYCYGMCSGIITASSSGVFLVNGVTLPVHDIYFETTPIEEKPLEWAEVERQLDDFMDELNEGAT